MFAIAAAAEGWALAALFIQTPTPKVLALFTPRTAALPAWIAAALITAASACSLTYIATHFFNLPFLKLLATPFALITGAFEEFFFRCY